MRLVFVHWENDYVCVHVCVSKKKCVRLYVFVVELPL